MKINALIVIGLILGISCGAVFAQDQTTPRPSEQTTPPAKPKTLRITRRQINQQARIRQGVRSGELTKSETDHLEDEQAKIQADKSAAKADGKVTPQERRTNRREQNKANRDIYRLKHHEREQK